jgi:competence protein ComEC
VFGLLASVAFLLGAGLGPPVILGIGLLAVAWLLRSPTRSQARGRVAWSFMLITVALAGVVRTAALVAEDFDFEPGVRAVRGEVRHGLEQTGSRQRFELDVQHLQGPDWTWIDSRGILRVSAPRLPVVRAGDMVRLEGQLSLLDIEPQWYRSYLRQQGIDATFDARAVVPIAAGGRAERLFDVVRLRIDEVLKAGAPGDAGSLLAGLVTGDDESLSADRKDAIRIAGLSHVTAISGANIALLAAVLAGGSRSGRCRSPWRLGATVVAIWAYALVVQMEPPVVRAGLVATLALVGIRIGRRPDYVTLTFLAAGVMVLIQPQMLLRLSFQLSFVAALALVMTAPSGSGQSPRVRIFRSALSVSVAQLATLPLLLPIQERLSLAAFPANFLIRPAVAVLFAMAFIAGLVGLFWPAAGESLAATAGFFADIVLRAVDLLGTRTASLPLWTVPTVTVVVLGMLSGVAIWGLSDERATIMRRWSIERDVSLEGSQQR